MLQITESVPCNSEVSESFGTNSVMVNILLDSLLLFAAQINLAIFVLNIDAC